MRTVKVGLVVLFAAAGLGPAAARADYCCSVDCAVAATGFTTVGYGESESEAISESRSACESRHPHSRSESCRTYSQGSSWKAECFCQDYRTVGLSACAGSISEADYKVSSQCANRSGYVMGSSTCE